jgi:hypothetical protein
MSEKSSWSTSQFYSFVNNIFAGVALIALAGIAGTLYTHYGTEWEKPIVNGLITSSVAASMWLSIRVLMSTPIAKKKITAENVGEIVLEWVIKFGLAVQSLPDDETYFFFRVETSGGKIITVSRSKKFFSDYLLIKALVNVPEDQKTELESLTPDEKITARLAIQLELSRAIMGFKTDNLLFSDLYIFKRIPVTSHFREDELMNVIWEVEAMITSVYMVGASAIHQHRINAKEVIIEA